MQSERLIGSQLDPKQAIPNIHVVNYVFYACSKLHLKGLLSMFTIKILTILFFLWLEDLWFYACVTFSLTKCEDRLPILFLYDILYYLLSQLRMFSIEQTHSFYMKSYWHDIKIGLSLMDWILMRQGLFTYVLVTGNLQKLASEGELMVSWSKGSKGLTGYV